jgi:hypothetical protein
MYVTVKMEPQLRQMEILIKLDVIKMVLRIVVAVTRGISQTFNLDWVPKNVLQLCVHAQMVLPRYHAQLMRTKVKRIYVQLIQWIVPRATPATY